MTTLPPASLDLPAPKNWRVGTLTYTITALFVLFGWLLWGDFAWSMKERTVGTVYQIMLSKFAASDTLIGVLMGSLPSAISMILTPIIAYKSDRFRSKWGRRIPFLILSTPFAVLAMVGVAFSPLFGEQLDAILGAHSPGLNNSTLIFLGFFWMVFELATYVAYAVFGGLINDVVPQETMGRFYGAFRALSLIAGIIFSYWLLARADTHYIWVFLGMGILYGGGFSMMCLKVREGDYPPPTSNPYQGVEGFVAATKGYFQECFRHRYYWWYFGAMALSGAALSPMNPYTINFAKSLSMDLQLYGNCMTATFCASLCLAYPLGVLVDRFHPLRVCLVVQALYAVVCLWGGIFVQDTLTFSIALVGIGIVSGMWYTVSASLGQRLLPQANFAQFCSAGGLVASVFGILLAPAVGLFLDYSNHNYRYAYLISAGLALMAFGANLVVYQKFMALGGPHAYVAPD